MPTPASPIHLIDEENFSENSDHIQQLEGLQKLLETAHQNEAKAVSRAEKAEEKCNTIIKELGKIRFLLSGKNDIIEKLTSERDVSAAAAKNLQKLNLSLQAQLKELEADHMSTLKEMCLKHQEDFNNSTKRHKVAIKKLHDLLEEKDKTLKTKNEEIAVLEQALEFNGLPFYSSSKHTLFQNSSKKEFKEFKERQPSRESNIKNNRGSS